jgi:hypothetical protein
MYSYKLHVIAVKQMYNFMPATCSKSNRQGERLLKTISSYDVYLNEFKSKYINN